MKLTMERKIPTLLLDQGAATFMLRDKHDATRSD